MRLYRPVGQKEYEQIEKSGFKKFPPRLEGQPIFYPVLNKEYAQQIARDWNTKDGFSGFIGYVLEFEVNDKFLAKYDVHIVGGNNHQEYWIPSADLKKFNKNIVKPKNKFSIYEIDKFVGDSLLKKELQSTFFLQKVQLCGTCYHEFKPGEWKNKHWSEDSIYLDDYNIDVFILIFEKTLKKYDRYYMQQVDNTETNKLIDAFSEFYECLKKSGNAIKAFQDIGLYGMITSNEFERQLLEIDIEKLLNTTSYFIYWLKDVAANYGCFALLGI